MDLALRRTHFRDVFTFHQMSGGLQKYHHHLLHLQHFDYIAVCNLSWAMRLLSTVEFDWFDLWRELGAFVSSEAYLTTAKKVNDLVKKHSLLAFPRASLVECGTLLGYRNPPFPGFDVFEEARALADGGDPHGLDRSDLSVQYQHALGSLGMTPHTIPFVSFHDYVVSGSWATSGSSSVGVVEWDLGAEHGHFKARKNLVPDSVDLEKLYRDVVSDCVQVNKTIIKAELGKIRLAVSSDLGTYLKMDWLSRYMTHAYKQWPGSTMEETILEQTGRQCDMWQQCVQGKWCLPFDFAGFDHQPTTLELNAMFRKLLAETRDWVHVSGQAEFDKIGDQVLASMHRSKLLVRDGLKSRVLPVTGGLMSGLRWTSLAGNGWNTTMTTMVSTMLAAMYLPMSEQRTHLRGDDSALAFGSWAAALVFRLGYTAVHAVGADGKFSIHHGATEFLRTWYDKDGLSGYAARSIPALVQRKPWNAAPWYEESVMESLHQAIRTLRRRIGGDSVEGAWRAIKTCWSRRKRLSQDWLMIPRPRGLGIEPWDGRVWSDTWYSTRGKHQPTLSTNGFTAASIVTDPFALQYPVSAADADVMAQNRLYAKASSDDIPALNSLLRDAVVMTAGRTYRRPPLRVTSMFSASVDGYCDRLRTIEASREAHEHALAESGSGFARFRRLHDEFEFASEVGAVTRAPILPNFESLHPEFQVAREELEARGLRRSEAIDWLFGTSSFGVNTHIHPNLSSIVHTHVTRFMARWLNVRSIGKNFRSVSSCVSSAFERALFLSPLSSFLYRW
jgi:hypothetical protein